MSNWLLLFFLVLCNAFTFSQVTSYHPADLDTTTLRTFEKNKIIPEAFKLPILLALSHYPELKETRIIFREKAQLTPLTSRPRLLHTFKKKGKRTYLVTISNASNSFLEPILFKNLPFNAQVGVIGHELAHIADYTEKSSFQIIRIALGQLNSNYVDKFEYSTDYQAIEHRLGHQLLSWSTYVRQELQIEAWRGDYKRVSTPQPKERYMHPQTIQRVMDSLDY